MDYKRFEKIELMRIIECLSVFQDACESRGVKFNKFSEEDLLEIIYLYKAYKLSGEPPF
jgi:hypothetical protein